MIRHDTYKYVDCILWPVEHWTIEGISTAEHVPFASMNDGTKTSHECELWFHYRLSRRYSRLRTRKGRKQERIVSLFRSPFLKKCW